MSARACIKHGRCRRANTLLGLTMVHTFGAPGCAKGLCRHRVRQRSLQAPGAPKVSAGSSCLLRCACGSIFWLAGQRAHVSFDVWLSAWREYDRMPTLGRVAARDALQCGILAPKSVCCALRFAYGPFLACEAVRPRLLRREAVNQ
jgi:hypothetical protein